MPGPLPKSYASPDRESPPRYLYTTQSFAIYSFVVQNLGDDSLRLWAATRLNALQNVDSSNPLWLFEVLDRAAARGDGNNPKINELRAVLMKLNEDLKRPLPPAWIRSAPASVFEPAILRLDLDAVARRARKSGPRSSRSQVLSEARLAAQAGIASTTNFQPDEYLFPHFNVDDLEVVAGWS